MEFLTCVVAAEEDEYPDVAMSGAPLKQWSGFEAPGLDTTRIAALHSLLTGESLQGALDRYEPVFVTEGEDETLLLHIDPELFDALALLDDEALEDLAGELAANELYEDEGVDPEEVLAYLTALVELAQLAESQDQALFVWIKLLQN